MKRSIKESASSFVLETAWSTPRISLPLNPRDVRAGARELLRYIERYQAQTRAVIRAGESMAFGTSTIWFESSAAGDELVIHEPSAADPDRRVPGATGALRLAIAQQEECATWRSRFLPPRPTQLITVSAGVEDGDALEGIRYVAPDHMSGWYLSTDRYDGDIRSMRLVHAYHIVVKRPDIARFLALEPGFFFRGPALDHRTTPTEVGRSKTSPDGVPRS